MYDLRPMTDVQLCRLHRRVWNRITCGNGYQPYGYDRPTLRITDPGNLAILDACKLEATRRLHG